MARGVSCPICGNPVELRLRNVEFPFCSRRCKLLDLGKWLDEGYRIPGPRAGDEADAEENDPSEGQLE